MTLGDHKPGMCCHKHRDYYYIGNINHIDDKNVATIPGTQCFHSVRNTGKPGMIEVWASTCCCSKCMHGEFGPCPNEDLVLLFKWTCFYKNKWQKEKNIMLFENELFENHSAKYVKEKQSFQMKKKTRKTYKVIEEEEDSNFDSDLEFSDSDWEDNVPLLQYTDDWEENVPLVQSTDKWKKTVVASKSSLKFKTQNWLHEKPYVSSSQEREIFYSHDFKKSHNDNKEKGESKNCDNDNMLIISGIKPFTPSHRTKISPPKKFPKPFTSSYQTVKSGTSKLLTPRHHGFKSSTAKSLLKLTTSPGSIIRSSTPIRLSKSNTSSPRNFPLLSPIGREVITKNTDWDELYHKSLNCGNFVTLTKVVEQEHSKISPLPSFFVGDMSVTDDEKDTITMKYLQEIKDEPASKFKLHHPMCINTDGNCFMRSISRLVYGKGDRHLEIRCRIVLDCMKNIKNYTSHDYLMKEAVHIHKNCDHIGSYYCQYTPLDIGDRDLT